MRISSISVAVVTILAGKASASTPTRLGAMTEDTAANATSASIEHFANLPPFFQALVNPDNITEPQFIQDWMAEDELSDDQFDLMNPSSLFMSMSTVESAIANSHNPGGGFGSSGKSGKGNDCRIEQMRGSYVFKYDLWESVKDQAGWNTEYESIQDRAFLLRFSRPPVTKSGKGRGAMIGLLCVPSIQPSHEYAVAIQIGVSQQDIIPFRINLPDIGPDVSVQGEFNCKTEEVYFGLDYNAGSDLTFGFTTRKPAKKRSNNNNNPCS